MLFQNREDFVYRRIYRNAFVEQVQADVIGADRSLSVGQRHNTDTHFGIEADEASVPADTAIFPDYFLPSINVHVPGKSDLRRRLHASRATDIQHRSHRRK